MTWKEAMEEKGLSKCRKDKDQYLCNRPGPPAEFNRVSMRSVALEWIATAYSETAASTGCTRNAAGSSAWQKNPDYRCTQCQGTARGLYGRPQRKVQVKPIELEVVATSCDLEDMLSAADGCELSITTHVKTACKKFKELLPVLSSCHLSFKTCGHVYKC